MEWEDNLLLRKCSLIETVNDPIKKYLRHRAFTPPKTANFLTRLIAGLSAYSKKPKHPTIRTNPPIPQPQPALT